MTNDFQKPTPSTKKEEARLSSVFPNPRGWALHWNHAALQESQDSKSPASKPKKPNQSK